MRVKLFPLKHSAQRHLESIFGEQIMTMVPYIVEMSSRRVGRMDCQWMESMVILRVQAIILERLSLGEKVL